MNTHLPFALLRLIALLVTPLLFSSCEGGDSDPSEVPEYLDEHALTLDNKPGSVQAATPTATLTLLPTSASIGAAGDAVVFIAAGGQPPYTWGLSNPQFGYLEIRNGNPAIYHSTALRENAIFVKDRKGNVASSTIVVGP